MPSTITIVSSKTRTFLIFAILLILLPTLLQPSIAAHHGLLAVQRGTRRQATSCYEMVSRSQCSVNPKCRWCKSQDLDDMCFSKTEAWRLPEQVPDFINTACVNIPSVVAAESCEIRLENGVAANLVPHRFFITSSVLDLTIVGLDTMDGESNVQGQHPHYLKTCSKPNLDLGSIVYFLGHTDKEELTVGEGKVVIASDNLIKLSTDGIVWSPGSAGFDTHGNLAFM